MKPTRQVEEGTLSTPVSTCSGPARVPSASEDLESILRLVFEEKPRQLSGSVRLAGATAEASHRPYWVYGEVLPQRQQWLQADSGVECPRVVEAIIDRTVPPVVEGHVQRTFAPLVAEVAGDNIERQLTNLLTPPHQSSLGGCLVDLIQWVLERRRRTLPMSGAALGDPGSRPADRPTQV